MKKNWFLFLLVMAAVLYMDSCISVCTYIQPSRPVYLDTVSLQYYTPGDTNSYWVYKELGTNTLDTFYTIRYMKEIRQSDKPKCVTMLDGRKDFELKGYSESIWCYLYNGRDTIKIWLTENKGRFFYNYDYLTWTGKDIVSTQVIQSNTYSNVWKENVYHQYYTYPHSFYFARGVGLVKWSIQNKQYELVAYKL